MSNRTNRKKTPNFIESTEQKARELFAYDDDALLMEFKEAELELEQMKLADPTLEQSIAEDVERGFQALMADIKAKGIKPVTESAYHEKEEEQSRKVIRLKPMARVMIVAAVVALVWSGSVVAGREFWYQKVKLGTRKNQTVWSDNSFGSDSGKLEEAYERVYSELGITVLELGYIPKELKFESMSVEKGQAVLVFRGETSLVYLRQSTYPVNSVSAGTASDRREHYPVYNQNLDKQFWVEENIIDTNFSEYSTSLETSGTYFYVSGTVKKEEFLKIVQFLCY